MSFFTRPTHAQRVPTVRCPARSATNAPAAHEAELNGHAAWEVIQEVSAEVSRRFPGEGSDRKLQIDQFTRQSLGPVLEVVTDASIQKILLETYGRFYDPNPETAKAACVVLPNMLRTIARANFTTQYSKYSAYRALMAALNALLVLEELLRAVSMGDATFPAIVSALIGGGAAGAHAIGAGHADYVQALIVRLQGYAVFLGFMESFKLAGLEILTVPSIINTITIGLYKIPPKQLHSQVELCTWLRERLTLSGIPLGESVISEIVAKTEHHMETTFKALVQPFVAKLGALVLPSNANKDVVTALETVLKESKWPSLLQLTEVFKQLTCSTHMARLFRHLRHTSISETSSFGIVLTFSVDGIATAIMVIQDEWTLGMQNASTGADIRDVIKKAQIQLEMLANVSCMLDKLTVSGAPDVSDRMEKLKSQLHRAAMEQRQEQRPEQWLEDLFHQRVEGLFALMLGRHGAVEGMEAKPGLPQQTHGSVRPLVGPEDGMDSEGAADEGPRSKRPAVDMEVGPENGMDSDMDGAADEGTRSRSRTPFKVRRLMVTPLSRPVPGTTPSGASCAGPLTPEGLSLAAAAGGSFEDLPLKVMGSGAINTRGPSCNQAHRAPPPPLAMPLSASASSQHATSAPGPVPGPSQSSAAWAGQQGPGGLSTAAATDGNNAATLVMGSSTYNILMVGSEKDAAPCAYGCTDGGLRSGDSLRSQDDVGIAGNWHGRRSPASEKPGADMEIDTEAGPSGFVEDDLTAQPPEDVSTEAGPAGHVGADIAAQPQRDDASQEPTRPGAVGAKDGGCVKRALNKLIHKVTRKPKEAQG